MAIKPISTKSGPWWENLDKALFDKTADVLSITYPHRDCPWPSGVVTVWFQTGFRCEYRMAGAFAESWNNEISLAMDAGKPSVRLLNPGGGPSITIGLTGVLSAGLELQEGF